MSTLRVNNVSDSAGSATAPIADVINGSARAWVNFNGTGTVAIRQAYNVSSITDNGAGDYTVNFTTAMPNINYAICFGTRNDAQGGATGANAGICVKIGTVPTVNNFSILTGPPTIGSSVDSTYNYAAVFGAP